MIGYSFDAVCGDEYILIDLDTKKNTSIMKYRQKY